MSKITNHDGCLYDVPVFEPSTRVEGENKVLVAPSPEPKVTDLLTDISDKLEDGGGSGDDVIVPVIAAKSISLFCDPDGSVFYERHETTLTDGTTTIEWFEAPKLSTSVPIDETTINTADLVVAGVESVSTETETTQIMNYSVVDAYSGTIDDVLTDALVVEAPTWSDGSPVVAGDVVSWSAVTYETLTEILSDPTDVATVQIVTTDSTFIDGVKIRSADDSKMGGADLTADVVQEAGILDANGNQGISQSNWCFIFQREIEVDKNGNPIAGV